MTRLRDAFTAIPITTVEFWYQTKADGREVSTSTLTKALTGARPISQAKFNAILLTLNRISGKNYTRESFPDIAIIEEEQTTEEEDDHALAATA